MQYKNEYKNPWHGDGTTRYGPAIYRNNAPLVLEYKGYKVYKLFDKAFDIVFDGVCITQRQGYSKSLIDKIDNGECRYTNSGRAGVTA